jgi:uncharacterized protein
MVDQRPPADVVVCRAQEQTRPDALSHIVERAEIAGGPAAAHLAEVVDLLANPQTYDLGLAQVEVKETHMSLVFLAGQEVYKLKRPVKLSGLDFRSLEERRRSCEAELRINQILAPGVYLRVIPVARSDNGTLDLGGPGTPVDWLVVLRRLDEDQALDRLIARDAVHPYDLEPVCKALGRFYREQRRPAISCDQMTDRWNERIGHVAASLTDPIFDLPKELVDPPLAALKQFMECDEGLIASRVGEGRIVDGHGDLKPEHVYPGPPVLLIDRLEFDERLRWCDPFDEIAFLGMECAMLGAPWIAPALVDLLSCELDDRPPQRLLRFYRCYRASLRARLSIDHLRDEAPRTPERWPRRARSYLRMAAANLPEASHA